jgi:hypothetical protein
MLKSTVDYATNMREEAEAIKLDAKKIVRESKLDSDRIIQNERESAAHTIKRQAEKFQMRLMDIAQIIAKRSQL